MKVCKYILLPILYKYAKFQNSSSNRFSAWVLSQCILLWCSRHCVSACAFHNGFLTEGTILGDSVAQLDHFHPYFGIFAQILSSFADFHGLLGNWTASAPQSQHRLEASRRFTSGLWINWLMPQYRKSAPRFQPPSQLGMPCIHHCYHPFYQSFFSKFPLFLPVLVWSPVIQSECSYECSLNKWPCFYLTEYLYFIEARISNHSCTGQWVVNDMQHKCKKLSSLNMVLEAKSHV